MDMTFEIFPQNADRRTVLLIGNSFGILKRIAYAIQRRGHSVIWGDSGYLGLQIAETESPDLIICETDLPDVSGIQVCRIVKSSFYFDTPVVLVGKLRDEKQDLPQAFRAGADDYIGSFTDWQLVLAKIEWLLSRRTPENDERCDDDVNPVQPLIGSLN